MAKQGGKDANPILFYDKRNGLTAEYLLIRKVFSFILRSCTGDFVFRCKQFANKMYGKVCGESSALVRECLRENGCTGKMKRNSICGVSNSIKSAIWRFSGLFSLILCDFVGIDHVEWAYSPGFCRDRRFSLNFRIRTVLVVPPHHNEVWVGCMISVLWGLFWPQREFRDSDEGFIILWNCGDSRGFLRVFVWEWVKGSPGCVSRRFRGVVAITLVLVRLQR